MATKNRRCNIYLSGVSNLKRKLANSEKVHDITLGAGLKRSKANDYAIRKKKALALVVLDSCRFASRGRGQGVRIRLGFGAGPGFRRGRQVFFSVRKKRNG